MPGMGEAMLVMILMIVKVLLDMIMMIEMMLMMVQIVVVLDIARRGRGGFRLTLTHSRTTAIWIIQYCH